MSTTRSVHQPRTWSLFLATVALAANPNARADYSALVKGDNPKAYYRLNDSTNTTLINANSGSLGAAGNAVNDLASVFGGVVHSIPGAIAGDSDHAAFFDYTTRTEIPFNAAINTPATQPFTLEAWLYPSSDQVSTGMGALCNRWTQGGPRQGWVIYQRAPDASHCTSCGPGIGWEFRMYNGLDGSGHVDVTSGVPFRVGEWQHVAVTYIPVGGDPTNSMAVIYINGVPAATNFNGNLSVPGYAPVTGDHDPGQAVNGQPAMSIGGYNNANGGTAGFENPWFGGADEFAWYSTNLTDAQILAHYQNGTNANRAQSYSSLINSDHPVVYLRLDETAPGGDVAVNYGDLRSSADGAHSAEVKHPAASALAGRPDDGAVSYHQRNGNSTTDIPWLTANNPNAGVPFTFETWLRPTSDRINPGAAPVNNRYVSSGHRTGWVIFQRGPNSSYLNLSGSEGVGWNFRMYNGFNGSGSDVTTSVPYNMNEWQHFVVTWEPQSENGDVGANGNDQWAGILTAYFNGVQVAQNPNALYSANTNPTEDSTIPSDLAVGSYNAASGIGNNPYEGDMDELAFYNGIVLTPDQILAHYQTGTNSNNGTNYETLVFTDGLLDQTVPGRERTGLPTTYLRFNDPAVHPAANSGSLGSAADGSLVLTTNIVAGPESPAYAGFDVSNVALPLDGLKQWASLGNPAGLNISGQITLEAWVQPAATQGAVARIISHGPQTATSYPGAAKDNSVSFTSEVYLKIDASGANYTVGCEQNDLTQATNAINEATFPVPGGDLGASGWIHLVGTYDGANWKLYRNGALVATQASTVGALAVDTGDWAIGSTGNGWADNYAGNVDEVAIYGYALSASQVQAHFSAGTLRPQLSIRHNGSSITVTWPYGTLYEADSLSGPWTPVAGNPVGTYSPGSLTTKKFYRF